MFIGKRNKAKKRKNVPINNDISFDLDLDLDLSENIIIREWESAVPIGRGEKRKRKHKYKTQQYYKGVPIFAATLVTEERPSTAKRRRKPIFGNWYDKRSINIDVESMAVSAEQAIEISFAELGIDETQVIGPITPKLYIYIHENIPYLAWIIRSIEYEGSSGLMNAMVVVNANDASNILAVYNEPMITVEACGVGGNGDTSPYQYCVDDTFPDLIINDQSNLVLSNSRVRVYDNNEVSSDNVNNADIITCIQRAGDATKCDIQDPSKNGGNCVACDAFAFSEATFEMYNDWLNGEDPVASNGIPLDVYVHVGSNWANAFWSPSRLITGYGDGDSDEYPFATVDIVGHEIGHGFTDKGSNLIYSEESGGMNEAYADIVGECLKYYLFGSNDWQSGGDIYKFSNAALRYLYNPPLDGNSIDHYSDYYSSLNVHYSSGLYNKAVYLLSTSHGWSMEQIFKVFSTANLNYWTADSTFNQGVCALYASLEDHYGSNTGMESDLDTAFNEVGLTCPSRIENGGTSCGSNIYCFFKDIYPSNNAATSFEVIVRGIANAIQTDYRIKITSRDNICLNPTISVEYEEIDYNSQPNEYFRVYDNDDTLIQQCFGQQYSCDNIFVFCVQNYALSTEISVNGDYYITISQGPAVHTLCDPKPDGADLSMNAILTINCAKPENPAPTSSPTTKAPTTKAPTTKAPTTQAPTTKAPTTKAPTTKAPTTKAPTTKAPTTQAPTTKSPTKNPTPPTTQAPTTKAPTTKAPTTKAPTTKAPTTQAPTTKAPTTKAPTTKSPTTKSPTNMPTTKAPTTKAPTTKAPTTKAPTTKSPTTKSPTNMPTTKAPTTKAPTTKAPTTKAPTTQAPTTKAPTTKAPTTKAPTTRAPTTKTPTNAATPTVFNCDVKDECKDDTLVCGPGICTFYCTGEVSCAGNAVLDGSSATSVNITCSNKDSCKDASFICPNSGTCTIECSGDKSCDSASCDGSSCPSNFGARSQVVIQDEMMQNVINRNDKNIDNDWLSDVGIETMMTVISILFIINLVCCCIYYAKKKELRYEPVPFK